MLANARSIGLRDLDLVKVIAVIVPFVGDVGENLPLCILTKNVAQVHREAHGDYGRFVPPPLLVWQTPEDEEPNTIQDFILRNIQSRGDGRQSKICLLSQRPSRLVEDL